MKAVFENWRRYLEEDEPHEEAKLILEVALLKENYSYSFGQVGRDSVAGHNQDRPMYGASMNKPILAFINLVLAKDGASHSRTGRPIRRLTPREMNKLISYSGGSGWSNRVNRALSNMRRVPGKDPNNQDYYRRYSQEYGVSKQQAQEALQRFGLEDTIKGVHWGGRNNQQSARGYNRFMSLMVGMQNNPDSEYHDEAKEVLSYVQRRQGGSPGRGLKSYLNKELEKAGYGENAIKTIYGKGGRAGRSLNYSVVVNDKYVFSMYTRDATSRRDLHKQTLGAFIDNVKPEDIHKPLETSDTPTYPISDTTTVAPEPTTSSIDFTQPEPVTTGVEAPPQSSPTGKFVHGFKRRDVPDFNFDEFYKKLDDAGLAHQLGDWGKDYKYGKAHDRARKALANHEISAVPAAETPVEAPSTEVAPGSETPAELKENKIKLRITR